MRAVLLLGTALSLISMAAPEAEPFAPVLGSTLCSNEAQGSGGAPKATGPAVMLPGFGNAAMKIAATPEAQRWFDYGLTSAWAFAHEQAKSAFAEAARLDPGCAMCVWGQAMAAGPTINYPIDGDEKIAALALASKARSLAQGGPARTLALTDAMVVRYTRGDTEYAKAMQAVARTYPNDNEVLILTADALMVAEQAKDAVPILETVLARDPQSTGAIHFYIHATEWIDQPGKAEVYADTLRTLAPEASHLIHMPSHTYYQIGRYRDAAFANLAAIDVDQAAMRRPGAPPAPWMIPYFGHNVSFALGGAMMAGEPGAAIRIADMYQSVPAEAARKGGPYAQMGIGAGWAAYGRFSDPERMLAMAGPDKNQTFVRAMWRYGRGEAQARRGDLAGLKSELLILSRGGETGRTATGALGDLTEIAQLTLEGRAAMLQGNYRAAADSYRAAARAQEDAFSTSRDPPAWWYPARRSLAAALLAQGKYGEALDETDRVLKAWPKDPMTLLVRSRAQAGKGDLAASRTSLGQARQGWGDGDIARTPLGLI